MAKYDRDVFQNVKSETIKKIYDLVTSGNQYSRKQICEMINVSDRTVGKVLKAYSKLGLVKLTYSKRGPIGRRSKLAGLHKEHFIIIYDMSKRIYTNYIVNAAGKVIHKFEVYRKQYPSQSYMADLFFRNVRYNIKNYYKLRKYYCFGEIYLLPGDYDEETNTVLNARLPEINELDLKQISTTYNYTDNKIFANVHTYYAKYVLSQLKENEYALVIFYDRNELLTAFMKKDDDPYNIRYRPFAHYSMEGDKSIETAFKLNCDPVYVREVLTRHIENISKAIPIDRLFIFGNKYSSMQLFNEMFDMEYSLHKTDENFFMPEFDVNMGESPYAIPALNDLRDRYYLHKYID